MTQLDLIVSNNNEWKAILEKYGNGMVDKRVRFEECTTDNYPGHHVVHGRNTQTGSLTNTGFYEIRPTKLLPVSMPLRPRLLQ